MTELPPAAALAEALPCPIWAYDADGRLTFVNAAAFRHIGVNPAQLPLGTPLADWVRLLAYRGIYGPGDPAEQAAEYMRLDRSRPQRRLLRRADGNSHEFRSMPLPGGGFAGMLFDVTDLAAGAEEALARTRLLEEVLSRLHSGLVLYDAEHRLLLNNPAFESAVGLSRGQLRPGMTQAEVLDLLARRGEFANLDAEELAAELLAVDRSRPYCQQRQRPNGQVLQLESRPVAGGGWLLEATDITAIKRMEDEARRRAALLDGVLEALPLGIMVVGPDLRVSMVNANCRRILGQVGIGEHREDIARRRALAGDYGPGEIEALIRDNLTPLGAGPTRRLRSRPGDQLLEIRTAPLPDGGYVQVVADVTALHRVQAEATERARLLQLMLDHMRHGIALFDRDKRLITANALAARLIGLPPAMLRPGIGMRELREAQAEAGEFGDPAAACALIGSVEPRDRSTPFRYTRPRPDGTVLEIASDPTPDGGFVVTYADVTATTQAEEESRQQAATLQAMLDNMRLGVMLFGPDRRVRAVNRLTPDLVGLPPDRIRPGMTLEELVQAQVEQDVVGDPEAGRRLAAAALSQDRSRPQRLVRRTRDGRVLEVRSDPMPDGGFVVSHLDISALAMAEEAAQQRAGLLQAMLDNLRHGIALYGPDRRLRMANRLAGPALGLPEMESHLGARFEELLDLQGRQGYFGPEPRASRTMAEIAGLDRSRRHRYLRQMPNGRVVEVASSPTPEGGFVITHTDVSELAQARIEAQQRAAESQAMLDNIRHGIALYGPDGRLVTANHLAAGLSGLAPEDMRPGRPQAELIQRQFERGAFGQGPAAEAHRAAMLARDWRQPMQLQRRETSGRIIDVTSNPTPDGGYVLCWSDVTTVVEAQAVAAHRAGVLQVMLDNMRHGICYYGPDRRVIAANVLAERLAGHAPGTVVPGRPLDEIIDELATSGALPESAHGIAEQAKRLDRSKPARHVRATKDGRILEVTSDPTPDGGFVVTSTDITRLAEAEAVAQQRAGVLQVMLDNIRHGIVLFDAEGRLVTANPVAHQLLGLPEAALRPGRHFHDYLRSLRDAGVYGEGTAAAAEVERLIHAFDPARSARRLRNLPDGRTVEVVVDPTPDGGFVLTYTDVTEDRRIRAELQAAREAAEAANLAKSRFLATMTHELRTPLNAVIGFSEALQTAPEPEQAQEFLRSIHEAGRHLLSLVDDILDVTRGETSGFQIVEDEMDLAALCESVTRVMRAAAAANGVRLGLELAPPLPNLRADEVRLRQVLLNLLSNAVKFTPAGGSVTLSAGLGADGALLLRVRDTGIGMPAEAVPRAFEPFTQLDSSLARRFPGSGLGLYLSRALAEAQGATLTLESRSGEGTTAVLRFPPERLVTPHQPEPLFAP